MSGADHTEQPAPQSTRTAATGTAPLRNLAALVADGLAEFANATLGLDPAGTARLAALEGSRLLIMSRDPAPGADGPLTFTLAVQNGRLRLLPARCERPNVIVTGALPDLLGWALSRGRRTPAGLSIEGDTRLLEALAEIAHDFAPDLAPPLRHVVGAAAADQLVSAAEFALAGLRSLLQGAGATLKDGARYWFAADAQRQVFLTELDLLRLRVDRLAARVELETSRRRTPEPGPADTQPARAPGQGAGGPEYP
jgi:ubiquinone biosynthesis protein UbiJ